MNRSSFDSMYTVILNSVYSYNTDIQYMFVYYSICISMYNIITGPL